MNYKYYKQEPDGYVLRKPNGILYFAYIIFGFAGVVAIFHAIKTGSKDGYLLAGVCALFILIPTLRQNARKVTLIPEQKKLILKQGNKIKEYPFDDFLNFHTTVVYSGFISTQRHVYVYFNENGNNKNILLGIVFGKKRGERLINETSEIMGKDGTNN